MSASWVGSASLPLVRMDGVLSSNMMTSKMNDALPDRLCHGVRAAGGVELVEQRAEVELGGGNRDAQPPGDRLVRCAFGHQGQHFEFAPGQGAVGIGGG